MAHNFIEHVNITVSNPDRTADYLMRIFNWHIRWRGHAAKGGNTIHVGNEQFYLAVYALELGKTEPAGYRKGAPLNHIGIVVDDLDEVERRVIAEGYEPFSHDDYEPGKRFYFFDHDGVEFEIIHYVGRLSRRLASYFFGWRSAGLLENSGFRTEADHVSSS